MKIVLLTGSVILAGVLFLAGCGDNENNDTTATANTLNGVVADGYIKGAKVCADINKNGYCDSDENFVYSDNSGNFSLQSSETQVLVAEGGFNTVTGENIDRFLAPVNSYNDINITPITTLGTFLMLDGYSYDEAKEKIKNLMQFDYDINVFEDPNKDINLLKTAALVNGVSKILMKKNSMAFDDAYRKIIDFLEGKSVLSNDINTSIALTLLIKNFGKINEIYPNIDKIELETSVYKAVDAILNNSRVYMPIGIAFNHKWNKWVQKYPGDFRYENSEVNITDGINLKTTKIPNFQSRATVFSWDFDNSNAVYEKVYLGEVGKYTDFTLLASTPSVFSSTSQLPSGVGSTDLSVYGGISVFDNHICFWGGVWNGNNEYELSFGCSDVNTSLSDSIVNVALVSNGSDTITFKVSDNLGKVLFTKDVNMSSEFNLTTAPLLFTYTKSRVRINDDYAAENNDTAINEAYAKVLDCNISIQGE